MRLEGPEISHAICVEFQTKVELDMLVFGSVVVSRTGQRIGRGNGYVDLDFGILTYAGAITPNTVIVTLVHDKQVRCLVADIISLFVKVTFISGA